MTALLLDENLSEAILGRIELQYPGSAHVRREIGTGATDEQVWQHARDRGFVLLTRDEDFERLSSLRGAPPKVLLLSAHNVGNNEVVAALAAARGSIDAFLADEDAALLVLGHSS